MLTNTATFQVNACYKDHAINCTGTTYCLYLDMEFFAVH